MIVIACYNRNEIASDVKEVVDSLLSIVLAGVSLATKDVR